MNWGAVGSMFLALAVGLGAFGAHGLRDGWMYEMGVYEKAGCTILSTPWES